MKRRVPGLRRSRALEQAWGNGQLAGESRPLLLSVVGRAAVQNGDSGKKEEALQL